MISTDVIANVRDRMGDADATIFLPAEMTRHLDAAVVEYSGYRPTMANTTIVSVDGTKLYDLPIGCMWLSRVWVTNADSEDADTIGNILIQIDNYVADYGEYRWLLQLQARYATQGQPIAFLWNRQLYLYPKSTESGNTINVDYAGLHVVAAGNYTTIPACDAGIVEDLMVARCYEAMAADLAKRPGYTEGQSKVDYTRSPDVFMKLAAGIRWRVQGALSEPIGLMG